MKKILFLIIFLVSSIGLCLKYGLGFTVKTELDILGLATLIVNISLAYYISVYLSKRNQELRSQKDIVISSIRKFLDFMFAEKESLEKLANNRIRYHDAKQHNQTKFIEELGSEELSLTETIQKQLIQTKNERNILVSMIDSFDRKRHGKNRDEIVKLSHELTELFIGHNERDVDSVKDLESWRKWMLANEHRYTQFVRISVTIMYKINAL